jgi:hypothetical protein
MTMNPEEFKKKMEETYPPDELKDFGDLGKHKMRAYNPGSTHLLVDSILCDILTDLGYGDGVTIFKGAEKWYE